MEVNQAINIVWEFHRMKHHVVPADAILVLGSHDTRVAERAADLWHQKMGHWLILSGGLGRLTEGIWQTPEADLFRGIALERGVPEENILTENSSTNSGENFRLTEKLLRKHGLFDTLHSFIVVQKPYMERRAYATFKRHWPEKDCLVTSPQMTFEQYCENSHPEINHDAVSNLMVGDLQRLWVYAERGFQVPVPIPDQIMHAYRTLVDAGYTQHLVPIL